MTAQPPLHPVHEAFSLPPSAGRDFIRPTLTPEEHGKTGIVAVWCPQALPARVHVQSMYALLNKLTYLRGKLRDLGEADERVPQALVWDYLRFGEDAFRWALLQTLPGDASDTDLLAAERAWQERAREHGLLYSDVTPRELQRLHEQHGREVRQRQAQLLHSRKQPEFYPAGRFFAMYAHIGMNRP